MSTPIHTDALVIGAGPVGLFQVFELGLLGLSAQLVDAMPQPGGQCTALYADKPIYDIPGLPRCTGQELVDRLLQQIQPFAPAMHLGQLIDQVTPLAHGWEVRSHTGTVWHARAVVIAAGVGAFVARQTPLPALAPLRGQQVLHEAIAGAHARQEVLVLGSDDSALQSALTLAQTEPAPTRVTLVHRRAALDASASVLAAWDTALQHGQVHFQVGQLTDLTLAQGRMTHVHIASPEGQVTPLRADAVIECLGLSPKLGPVAEWGLSMSRKQLLVNTETFATSAPGIFAVGDVIGYPGKKKLILSGFHEATLAAYGVAAHLNPGEKIPFEYTTASPRLHQRLGV